MRGPIRRVGNSLALLIPAEEGRRADLQPGQYVQATIMPDPPSPLGLLKDIVPYEEYKRAREKAWRERL